MGKYVYNDEDNRADVYPADVYAGTVTWARDGRTKDDEFDQLKIGFELDGHKGSLVFDQLTFSEKAGAFIDIFLKATGNAPKEGKGVEVELDANIVTGWRAWLNVGIEDDRKIKGKKKNMIINYILDKGVPPVTPEVEQHKGNDPF